MMILVIFFLVGFVQCVSSIKCYTCSEDGFFCSLPLNFEGDEEYDEHGINSSPYDSDHVCQNEHYIDPETGQEKIILRGTRDCKDVNIINHRTYCCSTNNCNKFSPPMMREAFIYSNNNQRYLPSMILIIFSVIFQYF